MADYRIIDADGHVMELDSELRDFIGPPYKDLEWHQSYSFWPGLTMDGYLRSLRQKGGWAGGGDGPKANHWLDFLDKNKIELTVLYPTQGLTHAAIQDKDWAICMARAYNDWLYHKFMKVSPRLVGVALLPVQDIGEAVKELRRAVTELRMVGAVLPAVAPAGRLYSGPEFYPLWEEAQKLDVPISTHGGLSMPALGLDLVSNFTIGHTLEHPFAQMRQFVAMMFEGVFELLRAKQREIEERLAYVAALREYWAAHADLEQLIMGQLPPEFRHPVEPLGRRRPSMHVEGEDFEGPSRSEP